MGRNQEEESGRGQRRKRSRRFSTASSAWRGTRRQAPTTNCRSRRALRPPTRTGSASSYWEVRTTTSVPRSDTDRGGIACRNTALRRANPPPSRTMSTTISWRASKWASMTLRTTTWLPFSMFILHLFLHLFVDPILVLILDLVLDNILVL